MNFTVIIPCYNAAATIPKTLESCLNQTHKDFSALVIDNASCDETGKILLQFKEIFAAKKIAYTLITNQHNQGPSGARNQGWDLAQGDCVAFLDDDDIWHPQKLEIMDFLLKKFPEIDCLGHAHELFQDKKDFIPQNIQDTTDQRLSKLGPAHFLLRNRMVTPSVVVRRSIAERFNHRMVYCEDHDFLLRMSRKHRVFYLDTPLVFLGRTPMTAGGLSANHWQMRLGEIRVYLSYAQETGWGFFLLPWLVLFSFLKYLRLKIKLLIKLLRKN